jgi:hypothetical protein
MSSCLILFEVFTVTYKKEEGGRRHRRRDLMLVGFITTYAISAYHH